MQTRTIFSTYSILSIIALCGVLVVNYLANSLPINGLNTGEVSDKFSNLFVPAGFTFAIWGLIYLLLVYWVVAVWKLTYVQTNISGIAVPFIISCIGNMLWIIAWHHLKVGLALILMLVILGALITLYIRIKPIEKTLLKVPVSIYLGWISVATIANTAAFLISLGVDGGNNGPIITMGVILVAGWLALFFLMRQGDLYYSSVILWAFIGIFYNQTNETIRGSIVAGIIAIILVTTYALFVRKDILKKY